MVHACLVRLSYIFLYICRSFSFFSGKALSERKHGINDSTTVVCPISGVNVERGMWSSAYCIVYEKDF